MKKIIIIAIFLSACSDQHNVQLKNKSMRYFFTLFGQTSITPSRNVKLQDLHIQTEKLLDTELIVSGTIIDKSQHNTYLIIKDKTGRLLVKTTINLWNSYEIGDTIKVLGKLNLGFKGLPFFEALALNKPKD